MKPINVDRLIEACDHVAHKCTMIAGTRHGSPWLFDRLMRSFTSCDAIESITFEVYLNAPVMAEGEATVGRDGSCELRRKGGA